jgi:hypothetical protein
MRLFLFSILSLLFLNVHATDSNLILWSADQRLTWGDFQGPADPQRKSGVEAGTQLMIELNTQQSGKYVQFFVKCFFQKNLSWTVNLQSSYLLAHEQLHFDIAELFAREIRKRLLELNGINHSKFESRVRQIYREVNREHNAFQDLYDKETDHSKNREKQAEWNDKVKRMLEETSAYGTISFSINLR